MPKSLDEIHPGEILLKEFVEPIGLTLDQLAASLGWQLSLMNDFVQGSQSMTDDMAGSLGQFFSMDAQFWLNLQSDYDRRVAKHDIPPKM